MATPSEEGFLRRTWHGLRSPSARWSVLSLLVVGALAGFVATAGTQVMVAVTGTDEFCGTTCHSQQWVAREHKASIHGANRTGVRAGCHDCHIPKDYPRLLFYKAKAGSHDIWHEILGTISTEEKFKKERERMAKMVWEEFAGNNSQACRNCHVFSKETIAKQKEMVRPIHTSVLQGQGTCIDCHKGVGHNAP